MPQLREWMLHFPRDWTAAQGQVYMQDMTAALLNASYPIMHALGPDRACAILLTVITSIARSNPVYHEDIKNLLASVYDLVDGLDPFKGVKKS